MAETQPNTSKVMPKYRITEKCYLNDRVYDPDDMPLDQNAEPGEDGILPRKPLIVAFAGVPAYYMEPMNEAAKEMVKKHPERMRHADPIEELTIVS